MRRRRQLLLALLALLAAAAASDARAAKAQYALDLTGIDTGTGTSALASLPLASPPPVRADGRARLCAQPTRSRSPSARRIAPARAPAYAPLTLLAHEPVN